LWFEKLSSEKVKASTLAQGDSPQHLRKERKDKQEKL